MNCGAAVIFIISSYTKCKAVPLHQGFSNFSMYHTNLEVLSEHRLLGPIPRISDSGGLRWGPRICISLKSPCDADAAGLGPPVRTDNVASPLEGWFLKAPSLWVGALCIRHYFSHHVWARTTNRKLNSKCNLFFFFPSSFIDFPTPGKVSFKTGLSGTGQNMHNPTANMHSPSPVPCSGSPSCLPWSPKQCHFKDSN